MKIAPTPHNEEERLSALYQLLILDTPPEERFDRIVAFAAQEFDTPMAQLTLIDKYRQWPKASFGLDFCERPREVSFCGHLIELTEGLIVEDATTDARFSDNPLVTGPPGIRFYAGAPLILPSGHVVGALCVFASQRRSFDPTDRAILRTLRDLVLNELLQRSPNVAN